MGYDAAMTDVTQILNQIENGEAAASEQLLPIVYEELRKLARQRLAHESPGQTLQATALVHEAYLRLVGGVDQAWQSRGHFFSAAAESMRRILVESARRKSRVKHGGGRKSVEFVDIAEVAGSNPDYLLDLNDALDRFFKIDPQTTELVKLRIFAGLTNDEAASLQQIPASTAKKHWMYARSWLRRELASESEN